MDVPPQRSGVAWPLGLAARSPAPPPPLPDPGARALGPPQPSGENFWRLAKAGRGPAPPPDPSAPLREELAPAAAPESAGEAAMFGEPKEPTDCDDFEARTLDELIAKLKGRVLAPAPRGRPGRDGRDGKEGRPGPPGPCGSQGERGPRGYDGCDGQDGARGFQGCPGCPGPQGVPGRNGAVANDFTTLRAKIYEPAVLPPTPAALAAGVGAFVVAYQTCAKKEVARVFAERIVGGDAAAVVITLSFEIARGRAFEIYAVTNGASPIAPPAAAYAPCPYPPCPQPCPQPPGPCPVVAVCGCGPGDPNPNVCPPPDLSKNPRVSFAFETQEEFLAAMQAGTVIDVTIKWC